MCLHSSRFDSLTQFEYKQNVETRVGYFFTSGSYYWLIDGNTIPSQQNRGGKLPFGFRGDASFFRQWKGCEDNTIVPMVIVVDGNGIELKYLIYNLKNQSWSDRPLKASEDSAFHKIKLYSGFETLDTILNLANIKQSSEELGDESLFIISTAKNKSIYYDWIWLNGCPHKNGSFKGETIQFFGGLLEEVFWKMDKSVDAAMVYFSYSSPKSRFTQKIGFCEKTLNIFK